MHSRAEHRRPRAVAALALAALIAAAPLRAAAPQPGGQVPSVERIDAAAKTLRQDPNLGGAHKVRTLRWVKGKQRAPGHSAAWVEWVAGLFGWFAQTSRFLFWGAVALLAGFLVIYLVRLLRGRPTRAPADRFAAPTHVRDLDIRPESLPDDIGAAARQLWQDGQRRGALALLYRGLISRLVHVHGVPIRGSSTEGECLALAAPRLGESPGHYAARLVRIWQLAVYGGRDPPTEAVLALCDEFAGALCAQMPAGASGAP